MKDGAAAGERPAAGGGDGHRPADGLPGGGPAADASWLAAFGREALGLPSPRRGAWMAAWAVLALTLAASGAAGVLLGRAAYRAAERDFVAGAFASLRLDEPAERRDAVRGLQRRRAALADSPWARWALAQALASAAEVLPDASWPLRQDALRELSGARARLERAGYSPPVATPTAAGAAKPAAWRDVELPYRVESLSAATLMALGEDAAARAALDRQDAWLAVLAGEGSGVGGGAALERLWAANNRAYLLATARDPAVRDPEWSLRLATTMMRSPGVATPDAAGDPALFSPTASAAMVDTLAAAYAANGRWDDARRAQRMALGLAGGGSLASYMENYRAILARRVPEP